MHFILGAILKTYLYLNERLQERMFHSVAIRYFGGVHPKVIYDFRTGFFQDHAKPTDIVIDVACGTGRVLGGMASKINKGMGIDFDAKNIEKAHKFFAHNNLTFAEANIFTFNYQELRKTFPYNKAVFSHILEHVEDVPALLKLVDASEILICVPSQENWYRQTLKHMGLEYKTDPTHFREYTRKMLIEELKLANYSIKEMIFNSEGEISCSAVKN